MLDLRKSRMVSPPPYTRMALLDPKCKISEVKDFSLHLVHCCSHKTRQRGDAPQMDAGLMKSQTLSRWTQRLSRLMSQGPDILGSVLKDQRVTEVLCVWATALTHILEW